MVEKFEKMATKLKNNRIFSETFVVQLFDKQDFYSHQSKSGITFFSAEKIARTLFTGKIKIWWPCN
jgi:hypothetical protein